MSYIIISNIGMALMMLILFVRYSHFRMNHRKEIDVVKKNYELKIFELKKAETAFDAEAIKAEAQKAEMLLKQVQELERERESESKLRINAEKQIDITNKKMQELEKRIEDWSVVQDSIMNDSREAIIKIGNDLFKKLNDSYKQEIETNRNLIGRIVKVVEENKELLVKFNENTNVSQNSSVNKSINNSSNQENNSSSAQDSRVESVDQTSKKFINEIVETMKAAGRLANKDYYMSLNFDPARSKLLLCELVFVANDKIYFIDFKATRYLAQYNQLLESDPQLARKSFSENFEKYIAYLSNPKYLETVLKLMSSVKVTKDKNVVVLALPSKKEMTLIKDFQYFDKIKQLGIEVMDFDLIVNVVI